MSRCQRHVGDVGFVGAVYRPCGKPAQYDVNDGVYGRPEWSACEEHAREAKNNGCTVDGLEDEEV